MVLRSLAGLDRESDGRGWRTDGDGPALQMTHREPDGQLWRPTSSNNDSSTYRGQTFPNLFRPRFFLAAFREDVGWGFRSEGQGFVGTRRVGVSSTTTTLLFSPKTPSPLSLKP